MSGYKSDIVAEWKQPPADRIDQGRQVAIRMLPRADRVTKQDISDESLPSAFAEIGNVAAAMARTMDDAEHLVSEPDAVAIGKPAIGHEASCRNAEAIPHFIEPGNERFVATMRSLDARAGGGGELRGAAAVIEMTMCDQHELEFEFHEFEEVDDLWQIAARIDHRGAISPLTPQDRAVLLISRDRQDIELHGPVMTGPTHCGKARRGQRRRSV